MTIQVTSAVWLDGTEVCDIAHLAEVSGLSIGEIEDLIENGLILPEHGAGPSRRFRLHHVVMLKTARRLRDDFQLDRNGVALALALLARIKALEASLSALQGRAG